jgi:hypothetical protein
MIIQGNTITVNGTTVSAESIQSVSNAGKGFYLNPTTIDASYTIPTGDNAMTAGPVTIQDGVTITVPDGSTWTVV